MGDYIEILTLDKKKGGLPRSLQHMIDFRATLLHCALVDLGFQVKIFTWNNECSGEAFVQERFERACATIEWRSLYPRTRVRNVQGTYSDHIPVLIETQKLDHQCRKKKLPRRFKEKWVSNVE